LLYGWFIFSEKVEEKKLPTVILFHGNAGNIGYRIPYIRAFESHITANFLMIEYRGYGKSTGTPSQKKLQNDCLDLLKYLQTPKFQE